MGFSVYKHDLTSGKADRGMERNREFHVPSGYNDNRIVLMVRDPWTLFTYWEVKKEVEDSIRDDIRRRDLTVSKSVLRVYDVTESGPDREPGSIVDFELKEWADSWYVHTGKPGRKWMVDIGILCVTDEFFRLARSNITETPPYGMSDIWDDEWACPEELYKKMFAITDGYEVGTSSFEMKEAIESHLNAWLSSGGITSGMFGSASFFLQHKK